MIQSNYKIVFKVQVFHSYFENSFCNCLQFKPTNETMELLNRFGFKLRNYPNGFDLYTNSNNSLKSLFQYISNTTDQRVFDFDIESDNPGFNCFTNLPADWIGQILFDSSSPSNNFENGSLVLATGFSKKMTSLLTGKLSVQFDDILKYTGDKQYADLTIQFETRNTQWQYFIVNKSALHLTNLFIKGNNIEFNEPENVTIQSGQQALMFSSGEHFLPLSKKPKYRFSLFEHSAEETGTIKKAADKIIFKGLPNPDPLRINIADMNGKQHVSSPMYVFV